MKAVDPSIRLYPGSVTHASDEFIDLMGAVHPYDGIDLHYYAAAQLSLSESADTRTTFYNLIQYPDVLSGYIAEHRAKIAGYLGEDAARNVDVVITEFGIGAGATFLMATLADALYAGRLYMNFIEDDITLTNRHSLTPWNFPTPTNPHAGMDSILGGAPNFEIRAHGYTLMQFANMTGTQRTSVTVENNPRITGIRPVSDLLADTAYSLYAVSTPLSLTMPGLAHSPKCGR
jgi:hypothetical protein